jgi:glycine hydroxymethyltransferase
VLIGRDGENTIGKVAPKSGRTRNWSELLDSAVMPGIQGGPLMHIIAAKAVAFKEALEPSFAEYQKRIISNASALADYFSEAGIRVVSGGTDNHLMLLDLTSLDISGKDAEKMLDEANITVNKNGIPFDKRSPLVTSGIRVGTPAATSRGMNEDDIRQVGSFMVDVLRSKGDSQVIEKTAQAVKAFTARFPRRA